MDSVRATWYNREEDRFITGGKFNRRSYKEMGLSKKGGSGTRSTTQREHFRCRGRDGNT